MIGRSQRAGRGRLFAALDEAADAGLVGVCRRAGRLRFSHVLVRDALYEDLPAPRRVACTAPIGEALEELYAGNPDRMWPSSRTTTVTPGPAVAGKAIDYAQRAGDRAASQHGYEEAAAYARALALLETARSGDDDRTRAAAGPRRGAEPRRPRRRGPRGAAPGGRARPAGRPGRSARARRYRIRRAVRVGAGEHRPLLRAAAGTGTGRGRPGRQQRPGPPARPARGGAARRAPHEQRVALAGEGVEMATDGRPGDAGARAGGLWAATDGPDGPEGRRSRPHASSWPSGSATRSGSTRGTTTASSTGMLGDRAAVDVELDVLDGLAGELRQPAQRWHIGTIQTMLALMEGRLEEAERRIVETPASASMSSGGTPRHPADGALRAAPRAGPAGRSRRRSPSVHEYPALLRFACALAHLEARSAEREARGVLDALLALDLERVHRDAEWLFSLAILSDPCVALGDERGAASSMLAAAVRGALHRGADRGDLRLDRLRARGAREHAGARDDAERQLEAAIEIERRMRRGPGSPTARSTSRRRSSSAPGR